MHFALYYLKKLHQQKKGGGEYLSAVREPVGRYFLIDFDAHIGAEHSFVLEE